MKVYKFPIERASPSRNKRRRATMVKFAQWTWDYVNKLKDQERATTAKDTAGNAA